jgi:hypothetical protein
MSQQRYRIVFRSRVDDSTGAGQRHQRFFENIRELGEPWGLGEHAVPPESDLISNAPAVVSFMQFAGNGITRTPVAYRFSRLLLDDGSFDDTLAIDFDPTKVAVPELIQTVMPKYIDAFGAYRAEMYDEQWADFSYQNRTIVGRATVASKPKESANPRRSIERVDVVSFYDADLCSRAFGLSSAEVLKRLDGKVERVQLLRDGVYIVGASQVIPFDTAQELCRGMTEWVRR